MCLSLTAEQKRTKKRKKLNLLRSKRLYWRQTHRFVLNAEPLFLCSFSMFTLIQAKFFANLY